MSQEKSTKNKAGNKVFGFLFGGIFFGMGALFCWMMGLSPLLQSLGSEDWMETSCVIESSEVESRSSSDGTTYSIEIRFSYTINGTAYVSDTYNFDSSSSSGRKGKAKVVRSFPVGSTQTCWVNPKDPSEAVLSREIPGIVYIIIPFSSIFMVIGLFVLLGSFGFLPKKWSISFQSNRHKRVRNEASGSQQLKAKTSRMGKIVGYTFFACFWNGIVSVFVTIAVKSHLSGDPEWFLTFFIIPFVCIGLGLIFAVFHAILGLANPEIKLTLSESSPALGDHVDLEWQATKPLTRVRGLRILLEGQEAATYRRGTDTRTDTSTFYRAVLLDLEAPKAQQRGTLSIAIPIDSMHSFDSGNNKILWQLQVLGDIPRFPDIKDCYPITVRPLQLH